MMGRHAPALEIEDRLALKIGKIISSVGKEALQKIGQTRQSLRAQTNQTLQNGRIYILDPTKVYTP